MGNVFLNVPAFVKTREGFSNRITIRMFDTERKGLTNEFSPVNIP